MTQVPGRRRLALAVAAATALATLAATAASAVPSTQAAARADARGVLASLDDQETRALHRMAALDLGGLHVTDKAALRSAKPVDVIVQLKTPPARTARLLAAEQGRSLSDADARAAVTKAHKSFRTALDDMFPQGKSKSAKAPTPHRTYTHSFDGVALTLPGNRVADLLDHDEVTAVWPDTKVKALADPESATATTVAPGGQSSDDNVARLHNEGLTGKGVKVGVIDTGIDYHHPDLKAAYAGGYDFVDDDADPMETTYADWKGSGQAETDQGSTYYTEHGTHVAGIVAGRGAETKERAAHGVAPGASVYAYRALGPYGGGTTSDIMAAMDKAADDGMDVVNMSLGASINDPLSPQAVAADNLVLAGITTVIAAGNSGPKSNTLGTPGAAALALTVGAHDSPLTLPSYTVAVGDTKTEGRLLAQPYGDAVDRLTDGALAVTEVGTGTAAGYNGKDVTGKAALVKRGGISLDEKVRRAKSKGAVAVLLVNDNAGEGHIPAYIGENPDYVPAFSLTAADGSALTGAAEVTFAAAGTFTLGDGSLADFSSRGPVYGTGAIKPEITAPGVSVLSSVPADIVDPTGGDYTYAYARLSGTSMATPFVAGVAALMLQHDPDLGPDDIKTALMNTAAPLPGDVSVFEAGAGGVDPYAAVHATTTLQVPATTAYTTVDGTERDLDHRTGALDLGVLPLGEATDATHKLKLVNDGGTPGTYAVAAEFTRGSGDSRDAAAAHVTLTTNDKVTVGAHGKSAVRTALHVPADAPAGYYEGHLTLTPVKGKGLHTLRVPFGMRLATSGFDEIDMTKSVLSTAQGSDDGAVGGGAATFNLKMAGQLRSVDVFLADTDGKDIGYVGGINTVGLTEGILYGPATVGAWYYPLTGDDATPVDPRGRWMDEGHYKLRIVGTDARGGTDSELRDVYVDSKLPTYDDTYGAWNPAHPTVVERAADTPSLAVRSTLRDGETDAIRAAGIDIGQGDNVLHYGVNNLVAPAGQTRPDTDGKVNARIPLPASAPTSVVKLWPTDAAGNIAAPRVVNVIKKGQPYLVGDASAPHARAGDRLSYTITAHQLARWKSYTSQIRYDDRNVKLVGIEPTAELAAHDPSGIRRTDVSAGASSYSTVSFDVGDTQGLTGDSMPLLKLTYEVTGGTQTSVAGLNTGTTSAVDTAGTKTNLNIQFYGAVRMLGAKSSFSARPAAEALLTKGYSYDADRDYSADDIKATLTAPDGTVTTLEADKAARVVASSLTPAEKPYRFQVKIPGHFTWSEDIDLGLKGEWGLAGTSAGSSATLVAGDVNGDDVIDVRDAAAVYAARGTADRNADIDHDGTVGAKDLTWVAQNYLRQNSMADRYTAPVKRSKGRTLEDYLDLM
ncbi:S8 family serine peptidase [Streptomyces sp. NBC_01016]|uniref:S8 family serine peptidase n=1 Tax=Streptomyces sp. NBC_01016 TaxID=2903720 RepID=UPI00225BC774|nr:S8 family serine peptidase [Streptomyces sp. NBC_01016]MCX4831949.1 S8 family serine peptidase [Streptomyces sp. NBC_01016]